MRRKYCRRASWDVGCVLDKHRAARAQVVDDDFVVHDLVAHVDGSFIAGGTAVERQLDRPNGAFNASAEAAWRRQQDDKGH